MMKFNLFGNVPVTVHPIFWAFSAMIAWISASTIPEGILWIMIIFVSVLVHEMGHALTAKAFGQKTEIELQALGGVTQRSGGVALKPWKEALIVLNGPLAGFFLCGLFWAAMGFHASDQKYSLISYAVVIGFWANLFWTIVNLVPVQPLDGGKLLVIVMQSIFGIRGIKISLFISLVVALLLGVFFFSIHSLFSGSLFLMIAFENYRTWKESLGETQLDYDVKWQEQLQDCMRLIGNQNNDIALHRLEEIRKATKQGGLYVKASELAASIYDKKNDPEQVDAILYPLKNRISSQYLALLHLALHRLNKSGDVIAIGSQVYQSFPKYEIALINAMAHAKLNQAHQAIGWLRSAIQQGAPDPKILFNEKEFDSIRGDPLFRSLVDDF